MVGRDLSLINELPPTVVKGSVRQQSYTKATYAFLLVQSMLLAQFAESSIINNFIYRSKIKSVCMQRERGEKEKRNSKGDDKGCLIGKKKKSHNSKEISVELCIYTEALPVQLFKRL